MLKLLAPVAGAALLFALGIAVGLALAPDGNSAPPDGVAEERATIVTVVDGDTAILDNGEPVRFLGIDTPEVTSQDCYSSEATERTSELLEGKTVTLVRDGEDRDQYDRLLRWIFLDDGTFVNAELIWEGYAREFIFGESRYRQVFVQLQLAASQRRTGGWSACDWR